MSAVAEATNIGYTLCSLLHSIQSFLGMIGSIGIVCSTVIVPIGILIALYGHFVKKSSKITKIGIAVAAIVPIITVLSFVFYLLAPIIFNAIYGGSFDPSNC